MTNEHPNGNPIYTYDLQKNDYDNNIKMSL